MPRGKGGTKGSAKAGDDGLAENTPTSATLKTSKAGMATRSSERNAFPTRLEWKMTNMKMPTTSTPKVDLKARAVTKQDVETAFGFDDSCEAIANYSTLISPIAHSGSPYSIIPKGWKVHPLTQRNIEYEPPQKRPVRGVQVQVDSSKVTISGIKRQESSSAAKTTRSVVKRVSVDPTVVLDSTDSQIIPDKPLTISLPSVPPVPPVVPVASSFKKPVTKSRKVPARRAVSEVDDSKTPTRKPVRTRRAKEVPAKQDISLTDSHKPKARSTRSAKKTQTKGNDPSLKIVDSNKSTDRSTRSTAKSVALRSVLAEQDSIGFQKSKGRPVRTRSTLSSSNITAEGSNSQKSVQFAAGSKRTNNSDKPKLLKKPKSTGKIPMIFEDPAETEDGQSPFSALIGRYNNDDAEEEGELHIDRQRIFKTYASKNNKRVKASADREVDFDFLPSLTPTVRFADTPKSKKPQNRKARSKAKAADKEEDVDEEARKWMEEKNKEFDDVMKAPLVIENSFSD